MNPLPKVAPASAWGVFICGVGVIWTWISYFGMCSGINQMLREEKAQGISVLIPIWGSLYCETLADLLNEIIQKEGLAVAPVEKPNIVLCFLFILLPWSELFTRYNEVATAFEAKYAATATPAA
jgi:hypothetical protein